jgi:hypothetical protein
VRWTHHLVVKEIAATILEEEITRRILGKVFDGGRSQASTRETGAPPHTGKEGLVVRGQRSARFLFFDQGTACEGGTDFVSFSDGASRAGAQVWCRTRECRGASGSGVAGVDGIVMNVLVVET